MTGCPNPSRHRHGFTLVELLTVIGIIALLISILLPSLGVARRQAQNVKVATLLSAIDKALQMFHNDFSGYPDSRVRTDPITGLPDGPDDAQLGGAHWLARALAGHDGLGVDAAGYMMMETPPLGADDPLLTYTELASGRYAQRKAPYMEAKIFALDNDPSKFQVQDADSNPIGPNTGRRVVIDDAFGYPILYYRASPKAGQVMMQASASAPISGIYTQADNDAFTNWNFAGAGWKHGLAYPGTLAEASIHNPPPTDYKGKTFADYFHNHNAHQSGGAFGRPHNPDKFVLISPGYDGIYGTDDDINNFKGGL